MLKRMVKYKLVNEKLDKELNMNITDEELLMLEHLTYLGVFMFTRK